jgi:hypothetical protein
MCYGLCDCTVSSRVRDLIKRAALMVRMCVRTYLSSALFAFTVRVWAILERFEELCICKVVFVSVHKRLDVSP